MAETAVTATVTVRPARLDDAAAIAAIWNREVRSTDATTDTEPRDLEAQRAWLADRTVDHPVVVATLAGRSATGAGRVVGFAALSPYRPKPAFRETVEDSVYVDHRHRGAGVGAVLLAALLRLARERGHHAVIARITSGNQASIRLHERHGFQLVGVEREIALKHARWLDVAIMQLLLA